MAATALCQSSATAGHFAMSQAVWQLHRGEGQHFEQTALLMYVLGPVSVVKMSCGNV